MEPRQNTIIHQEDLGDTKSRHQPISRRTALLHLGLQRQQFVVVPVHLRFLRPPGQAHDVHEGGYVLARPVVVDAADVVATVPQDQAVEKGVLAQQDLVEAVAGEAAVDAGEEDIGLLGAGAAGAPQAEGQEAGGGEHLLRDGGAKVAHHFAALLLPLPDLVVLQGAGDGRQMLQGTCLRSCLHAVPPWCRVYASLSGRQTPPIISAGGEDVKARNASGSASYHSPSLPVIPWSLHDACPIIAANEGLNLNNVPAYEENARRAQLSSRERSFPVPSQGVCHLQRSIRQYSLVRRACRASEIAAAGILDETGIDGNSIP